MLTRTTTQLLDSLKDPSNDGLWRVFDERYRPVLLAFARRQGLDENDAQEAAQATLAQFAADYQAGRYDRSRGRLSSWIIGIARNRIVDAGRARQLRRRQRGESGFVELSDDDAQTAWQEEQRKVILRRAMQVLRERTRMDERTLHAFELCAVRGVPPERAAEDVGMSVPEVYVAKNRAIKRLREFVDELTQEYDES